MDKANRYYIEYTHPTGMTSSIIVGGNSREDALAEHAKGFTPHKKSFIDPPEPMVHDPKRAKVYLLVEQKE